MKSKAWEFPLHQCHKLIVTPYIVDILASMHSCIYAIPTMHLNIEIKARCADHAPIRRILQQERAEFCGTDHQLDTYFRVPQGRLKLRRGTIENNLIQYHRDNQAGPKASHVHLYPVREVRDQLHAALAAALGILVEVDKKREIYFLENVKFHLDTVQGLGTFVEIEAIDEKGTIGAERLHEQCEHYLALFQIAEKDLLTHSYSDMLLEPGNGDR
jgi:adenylate cyclase class 2